MTWDEIKINWNKINVLKKYTRFDYQDSQEIAGDRATFITKVQEKYGYSILEAILEVDNFAKSLDEPKSIPVQKVEPVNVFKK